MIQTTTAMMALLGLIAIGSIGMVSTVKAYHDSGGAYYTCPWNGCHDSVLVTQPHITTVHHSGICVSYDCSNQNSGSENNDNSAFVTTPHIQTVAMTDNCFWSYPVQCS